MRSTASDGPAAQSGLAALSVVVIVCVLGVVAAIYFWAVLGWNYSTGERAGWVQKLSEKGWICKTWEGELAMVAVPGSTPEKFYFTVRDSGVAAQINALMGRRVSLHYEEKVGLPTSCFGETRYYVTQVTAVAETQFMQGAAAPPPPITAPPATDKK